MVETIYPGNLHYQPLQMLKVFLVIVESLSLQFFFARQSLVTDIFHKMVAPHLYNYFLILWTCSGFDVP